MKSTRVILLSALTAALVVGGCSEDPPGLNLPASPDDDAVADGGGDGDDGEDVPEVNVGEEMFHALEADFVAECGSCHQIGGMADTPFLGDPTTGDPDPYATIISWPGILATSPQDSVLLTWPGGGAHNGPPTSPNLEAKLVEWLTEEASSLDDVDDEPLPTIPPFVPIVGFNAVYLDPLAPELEGMSVTFECEELTESVLRLSNMQVIPTADWGLGLEHPLFSVYAPGSTEADPDPVDSFSNVVQEFAAGGSDVLGPGSVFLTNWVPGGKLSLSFLVATPLEAGVGGPSGACNALTEFEANAQAALQNSCTGCHGGNNQTATNALDMSALGTDSAAACGQILTRVDLGNPTQSQLFITTDPNGNASHPFKFGGNANNHNDFVNTVTTWLEAEAQ